MLLEKKKIIIFGLANKYSIAAGIAKSMITSEGATIGLAYQNERLLKNIKPIAKNTMESDLLIECDVSKDDSIEMF